MVELARSQNEKLVGRNKSLETPSNCKKMEEESWSLL
jgi:hypothetical protein